MNGELIPYAKLVSFLGECLGGTFEACLFDLAAPGCPVIASVNSHGGDVEKVRAFVREAAGSRQVRERGYFANRPIEIDFAKLLKSSVFFIYDTEGMPVGALCLNMRCDLFMKMVTFANSMLQFNIADIDDDGAEASASDAAGQEPSLDTITRMVSEFGVEPGRFSPEERMEIILDLYDVGVFELKGAVARCAEELRISVQSVYRYLTKIKQARDW